MNEATLAEKFLKTEHAHFGGEIIEIGDFQAVDFWDEPSEKQRIAIVINNADDITHAVLTLFEHITFELSYHYLERTEVDSHAHYYDGDGKGYQEKYPCGYAGGLIIDFETKLPNLGLNGKRGDFPIFIRLEKTDKWVRVELEDLE